MVKVVGMARLIVIVMVSWGVVIRLGFIVLLGVVEIGFLDVFDLILWIIYDFKNNFLVCVVIRFSV